jgi:hypothetical protein
MRTQQEELGNATVYRQVSPHIILPPGASKISRLRRIKGGHQLGDGRRLTRGPKKRWLANAAGNVQRKEALERYG